LLSSSGMAATKLELIENRRSELQAAFLAFGSVSEQLSGAFDALRAQVADLRAELSEAEDYCKGNRRKNNRTHERMHPASH